MGQAWLRLQEYLCCASAFAFQRDDSLPSSSAELIFSNYRKKESVFQSPHGRTRYVFAKPDPMLLAGRCSVSTKVPKGEGGKSLCPARIDDTSRILGGVRSIW